MKRKANLDISHEKKDQTRYIPGISQDDLRFMVFRQGEAERACALFEKADTKKAGIPSIKRMTPKESLCGGAISFLKRYIKHGRK